jgi:regulator of protease activity HflC (stomatin/prohibitin superfamily)
MGYIFFMAFLLIAGAAVYVSAPLLARGRVGRTPGLIRSGAAAAVLVLGLIVTALSSTVVIDGGKTGLVYQFGTSGTIVGHLDPGFNVKLPWHGVREVNTRIQKVEFDRVEAFSSESQPVIFDLTLNYFIDTRKVDALYTRVGPEWASTLLFSRALNDAKEASNRYTSVEIAPHREDIRKAVAAKLRTEMEPYGVGVESVQVKDIRFSPEFTAAIEQKQRATQEAAKAEVDVRRAKAEADQVQARARGDAQATLIRARAQSEANRLLQQKITPAFVDYQRVLALQKLAESPNIQLVPANAFFNFTPGQGTTTGKSGG